MQAAGTAGASKYRHAVEIVAYITALLAEQISHAILGRVIYRDNKLMCSGAIQHLGTYVKTEAGVAAPA